MTITLRQRPVISAGDIETVAIDYTSHLDSGELLTGTPTVTEQTTSDLTLGDKVVNSASCTILNRTVAIGAAVQFTVQGQSANTTYRIRIEVSTDATNARTFVRDVLVRCVE